MFKFVHSNKTTLNNSSSKSCEQFQMSKTINTEQLVSNLHYTLIRSFFPKSHIKSGATIQYVLEPNKQQLDSYSFNDSKYLFFNWDKQFERLGKLDFTKPINLLLIKIMLTFHEEWQNEYSQLFRSLNRFSNCLLSYSEYTELNQYSEEFYFNDLKIVILRLSRFLKRRPSFKNLLLQNFNQAFSKYSASKFEYDKLVKNAEIPITKDYTLLKTYNLVKDCPFAGLDISLKEPTKHESSVISDSQEWLMMKTQQREGIHIYPNYVLLNVEEMLLDCVKHNELNFYCHKIKEYSDEEIVKITDLIKTHLPEVKEQTKLNFGREHQIENVLTFTQKTVLVNYSRFMAFTNNAVYRVRPRVAIDVGVNLPTDLSEAQRRNRILELPLKNVQKSLKEPILRTIFRKGQLLFDLNNINANIDFCAIKNVYNYKDEHYATLDSILMFAVKNRYNDLTDCCVELADLVKENELDSPVIWKKLYNNYIYESKPKRRSKTTPFTPAQDILLLQHYRRYMRKSSMSIFEDMLKEHPIAYIRQRARLLRKLRKDQIDVNQIYNVKFMEQYLKTLFPFYTHILHEREGDLIDVSKLEKRKESEDEKDEVEELDVAPDVDDDLDL